MSYRVTPMDVALTEKVRTLMISPFGKLPVWSSVATGYGPCRSCLKKFCEGEEERIYMTYDPFSGKSDLPLPGPVFIHSDRCEEFTGDGFPQELLSIPMLFDGYGEHSSLKVSEPIEKENFEDQIARMLSAPDVEFVHIRNAEAGCFIATIERS